MRSHAWRQCIYSLAAAMACLSTGQLHADDERASLAVSLSKSMVREAAEYKFRRWLRNRVWKEQDDARFGLQLDRGWAKAAARSPRRPLVVLVHGFNSNLHRNQGVLEPIRSAGYPCGGFAYPNDWELVESAALLSRELKAFRQEHPAQHIVLITHSMGGLVARGCLERPELDPGNVDRLIMIAPPSQGTLLAHFAVATDVWEHWLNRSKGGCWTRCRDSVIDGLGEAADDLTPGSPYLERLNAGPRNPRVQYTILLGTGAAVADREIDWIRSALRKTSGECPGFRDCSDRLNRFLADLEEIVDGKGDGVVAVKRGRLPGVEDIVILPFGHLSCTGPAACEPVQRVQDEILARLP